MAENYRAKERRSAMAIFSFRRIVIVIIALGMLAGMAGAGFLTAFVVRDYDRFPFGLANKIGYKFGDKADKIIRAAVKPTASTSEPADRRSDRDVRFSSVFTPITAKVVSLPLPKRAGYGGAATSWGKHVVVLNHEGTIYLVDSQLRANRSTIAPPENRFEAYLAMSKQPPWNALNFEPSHFRYNDIVYFKTDAEQGLLVSYTKFNEEKICYQTTIAKLTVAPDILLASEVKVSSNDWRDIYSTEPCLPFKQQWRAMEGHMAGGRIVFDGDKTLYLASGDYSWDGVYGPRSRPGTDPEKTLALARDPTTDYGKVIAIDIRNGEARQVSRGHRNMQGIARDRKGRVWVVEHGVYGGDELNLIREGRDYGWPDETYGTLYSHLPIPNTASFGRHEAFEKPRIAWLPSIAVSGLTRTEGFHEAWDGDLLVSTLGGRQLARVRLEDDRVVFTEFIKIGQRIRHVHQRSDGRIVLWTNDSQLFFLSPLSGGLGMQYIEKRLAYLYGNKTLANAVRIAIDACITCHSLEGHNNTTAPSLARVVGSPMGSTSYPGYSPAFTTDKRVWSRELLASFLKNPAAVVPGTVMPNPNITDAAVIDEITNILSGLANDAE